MIIPTFLKWAGGKRRVIDQIDPYIPREINTYFEPFLGGGSMFFYIKQKYNPKKCVLSDINEDLIKTFKAVRDNPKKLINYLNYFKKKNSKEFFYKFRQKFNENKIKGLKRCAGFIYLNKTCFNGLWRVNSKNEFNVPYGDHKNPGIFEKETILFASKLLKNVEILNQDYREILNFVKKGDFIYLDPCYDPLKKTSFANYNPKRFCEEDRIEMAKFIGQLNNKKISFALSNNKISEMKYYYPLSKFDHIEILAPRFINSQGNKRGEIIELLITSKNI
ncbi:MAG: Dam family site-specific DNA-(adenine-N6)-methyltransferase [Candidatus Pacearchaeota archaeon]